MLARLVSVIGLLVAIVLTSISIYASVLRGRFSLPTPLLGHILSIILPISTLLGLLFPTFITAATTKTSALITRHQPAILTLLSLLDSVLITLASTLLQPELQTCSLERRWRTLFQAHDVRAIRGIQDALECCGLRSLVDQPWPFPDHNGARRCMEITGRERSCEGEWTVREQRIMAIWIVVGVSGLLVKAMFVLLRRNRPAWFQDENDNVGRRHYAQGRVIDEADERVGGGRYLDQPSEETPLRSGEAEIGNEPSRQLSDH